MGQSRSNHAKVVPDTYKEVWDTQVEAKMCVAVCFLANFIASKHVCNLVAEYMRDDTATELASKWKKIRGGEASLSIQPYSLLHKYVHLVTVVDPLCPRQQLYVMSREDKIAFRRAVSMLYENELVYAHTEMRGCGADSNVTYAFLDHRWTQIIRYPDLHYEYINPPRCYVLSTSDFQYLWYVKECEERKITCFLLV